MRSHSLILEEIKTAEGSWERWETFFSVVETIKLFRLQYINPQPCLYR